MKLHLNRLPKKWHPFMIIIGCGCVCLIGGYSFLNQKVKTPAVATVQKTERMNDGIAGVGGEGTPDYNEMLTEDNHDRAQAASQKGKSFISAPVGKEQSLLEDVKNTSSPTQSSSTKTVPSASSQATSQTRTKDESKEIARLASYMEALRQASYKQRRKSSQLLFQVGRTARNKKRFSERVLSKTSGIGNADPRCDSLRFQ